MSSQSEKTFGSRLEKAGQIAAIAEGAENFAPPNEAITAANFRQFLMEVRTQNDAVQETLLILNQKRNARNNAYFGDSNIVMLAAQIRDYVAAMPEGKNSLLYRTIQKEVQKLRNYHKPEPKSEDSEDLKKISQSEQSLGSILYNARNVLSAIKNIPGYAPANEKITAPAFEAALNLMDSGNQEVAAALNNYKKAITGRSAIYDELHKRFQQVKDAVSSQYGKSSDIYKRVSAIKY